MPESTETLRNLLADELGECRDADLDARLAELDDLEARALDGTRGDLAVLDALADETRYETLRLLAAADELAVCEVDAVLSVSGSAVSHALAALADAGLVERRRDGRWRYYRATERAEAVLAALDGTRERGE